MTWGPNDPSYITSPASLLLQPHPTTNKCITTPHPLPSSTLAACSAQYSAHHPQRSAIPPFRSPRTPTLRLFRASRERRTYKGPVSSSFAAPYTPAPTNRPTTARTLSSLQTHRRHGSTTTKPQLRAAGPGRPDTHTNTAPRDRDADAARLASARRGAGSWGAEREADTVG